MTRATCAAGVAMAAAAAGPIFVTALGFALLTSTPDPVPVDETAIGMLLLFVAAIPFGAVLACLPLALGSVSLSLIGRFDETARLPVVWALAGAAMAGVPSLVLNEGATPESTAFVAAFAWTGAACALIAGAGTRWSDD